jgi:hypothetical protein
MPYGSGPLVRHALQRATGWQRYAIAAAMVAAGVVFVVLGRYVGGLLAAGGLLLLWRMASERLRRGHQLSDSTPSDGPA